MAAVFVVAYFMIAIEHNIKIDKAASALLAGGVLWVMYIMFIPEYSAILHPDSFKNFLESDHNLGNLPLFEQYRKYIVNVQILEVLGEISSTLFFLIGAMTIVELIDVHGGFHIITNKIATKNKKKLLWLIAIVTFFMSAVLDNMTTSIVMVMMLRRIIRNYKMRWLFASIIIIAANSGGAWSPIGDVTTIMIWIKDRVTSVPLILSLFLPSLISVLVPILLIQGKLKGDIPEEQIKSGASAHLNHNILSYNERLTLLLMGVGALLFVPVFKSITHLPPYIGILIGLSIIWIYTELLYRRKLDVHEDMKHRVTRVLKRIDTTTILFFLGILLAVNALQATGMLTTFGTFLKESVHNVYAINVIIGTLSAVVDNVPLVAVSLGMYPMIDPATVSTITDAAFNQNFVQDGHFWLFLAYCSGVGGSMLIIGSVAGVVVMGLERMSFGWYLKNISLIAAFGYLAGAVTYIAMSYLKILPPIWS